jgi:hypothetical protein
VLRLFRFVGSMLQVERYEGALVFIDISGFSRLSELLSNRHGAEGAELLQTYINRCAHATTNPPPTPGHSTHPQPRRYPRLPYLCPVSAAVIRCGHACRVLAAWQAARPFAHRPTTVLCDQTPVM